MYTLLGADLILIAGGLKLWVMTPLRVARNLKGGQKLPWGYTQWHGEVAHGEAQSGGWQQRLPHASSLSPTTTIHYSGSKYHNV